MTTNSKSLFDNKQDNGISSNSPNIVYFSRKKKIYAELSNFESSIVKDDMDIYYATVEHAFQAAKSLIRKERNNIALNNHPSMAKEMGRKVKRREDWDSIKEEVMLGFLRQKFNNIAKFKEVLLSTGNKGVVEDTTEWGDTEWGMVFSKKTNQWLGKNKLGKLLMQVRYELNGINSINSINSIDNKSIVNSSSTKPKLTAKSLFPVKSPADFDPNKSVNLVSSKSPIVEIYTDGSCIANPGGPGGWGALLKLKSKKGENFKEMRISGGVTATQNITYEDLLVTDKFIAGNILSLENSLSDCIDYYAVNYSTITNNRMEMLAVIQALRSLKKPCNITLYSDSQYVLKGCCEWISVWKSKNWKTNTNKNYATAQPIKNADLWQLLCILIARHRIKYEWVRGHNGHVENTIVDQLAGKESRKLLSMLRLYYRH